MSRTMFWWKRTAICIVLCMVFSLTACGGSQNNTSSRPAAEKDAQTAADEKETQAAGAGESQGAGDTADQGTAADADAASETAGADAAAAQETASSDVTASQEAAAADATAVQEAAAEDATAAAAETAAPEETPDYANQDNWAYFAIGEDKNVDLFLVCPTVDMRDEYNMSMDDEEVRQSFSGALNMERGIYEDAARMYAPYYRQAAMKIFDLSAEEREPYLEIAYKDVSAAFAWYLENENEGRPLIIAGFSQGADLCYRLMKEYFGKGELDDQLVAVYAIGWPMTQEMTEQYPQIKPAAAEDDTGVVISFDCESPELEGTFINPADQKVISINPLNWKADSTPADKSLNKGACFTSYSGKIKQEVAELCGCYIDEERGILKVTDVTPADYPPILAILPEGSYHLYDYQFFFRNLQENVNVRVNQYLENHQ